MCTQENGRPTAKCGHSEKTTATTDSTSIPGPGGPLLLTTARFVNRHWLDDDTWSKVLAHTGSYEQFACGTDTGSWWRTGEVRVKCDRQGKNPKRYRDEPLQRCIICSPWSGTVAPDIDHAEKFAGCATAGFLDIERDAISRWDSGEGPRCHMLADMRAVPPEQWPTSRDFAAGDFKSCGFIPVPGSMHYSGCTYAATVPDWPGRIIPGTPELAAAMVADCGAAGVSREHREQGEGSRWVTAMYAEGRAPCKTMLDAWSRHAGILASLAPGESGGRHTSAMTAIGTVLELAGHGHPGAPAALEDFARLLEDAKPGSGGEYDDMLTWAANKEAGKRTPLTVDPCSDYVAQMGAAQMDAEAMAAVGASVPVPGTLAPTVNTAPMVVRLADVEAEHIDWLWDGHLPLGKVVTMDGDPGVGKSTVMLDIAARVTAGASMPDGSAGRKGAVLVLSAEDGLADTIRPRLDAAGADCSQVVTITEVAGRPVSLPYDIPAVEQVITDNGVILVIVDVLMAYLDGQVNSHRDQDVRRALAVVHGMAERTGACVAVLRHLNKSGGANAVYRGGGSIGIIGAARAGFLCAYDPDDESTASRVLACVKINLAATPPSLGYTLASDSATGCAKVTWTGVSAHAAAGLVAESDTTEKSETRDAGVWLADYLTEHGGSAAAGNVIKAARAAGFAQRTLQRAREKLAVTTGRDGFGAGGAWMWRLGTAKAPDPAIGALDAKQETTAPMAPMPGAGTYDAGPPATRSDDFPAVIPWCGWCQRRHPLGEPGCPLFSGAQ